MSERTRVIIIVLAIIAAVAASAFFIHQRFFTEKFPLLKNISEQISNPGPLRANQNSDKVANNLADDEIIKWTNYYRSGSDLAELSKNAELAKSASIKANDMLNKGYFEHIDPNGDGISVVVTEQGYKYSVVGENLAMGGFANEKELVDAWMNSEGHRANIMNDKYTEIGVASVFGNFEGTEVWLSVQVFAKPSPNCTLPDESLKQKIEDYQTNYEKGDDLVDQYNEMVKESEKLIETGNAKISEGNEIAKTSGNDSAEPYWEEGKRLQNQGNAKLDSAEELKREIEDANALYNKIEELINKYNLQVEDYNACIDK